jgi:predicted AAA+ superfamily ATPase
MSALLPPALPVSREDSENQRAWNYFQRWGGMPAILGEEWSDDDRFEWLQDYQDTYLQRDLGDLARLDRLEPFVRAQKAAAAKASQTVNFSHLARLSDVAPSTARQFVQYLEISFQVFLLPAWFRNQEKRLAKQPRLHFFDPGIRRAILRKRGDVDGAEFEDAVVAEIHKQCRSARLPVEFHHLRTADGREVDLLLEREDGFIAVECKQASKVSPTDFRHLKDVERILDKPLLLGLVVSEDPVPRVVLEGPPAHWNVAAHQLLG